MGINVTFFVENAQIIRILIEESSTYLWSISGQSPPVLTKKIENWMEAYFSKTDALSHVNIPLSWEKISPFMKKVLETVAKISSGNTATYGEIAEMIGSPRAYRAVANCCRLNPFPLLVPCHRVVAKTGIGGYAYGLSLKQMLLQHELASF